MVDNGWGRIVNISSIWGKISKEKRAAYSASKFGLDGMTIALAAEYSKNGILANCVAPGFTNTELTFRVYICRK
jgi:3-oxoacyl-[acyl-carrier protein] reductase